ncbi:hypothetical protein DES53_104362 [Roseimicrobium gellanilyticum]|uniref:Uncharacterized protein n=1 Tax=Roseimicrobium gellanilyticum TaxID=748857 RepID=A0A366HPT8_9BACT|nr:hypothetical protein [Roseimicrobium gellanilyticum]RBP44541.1 hypothetical protein DES53_104362 [Roseimicrobium gellanilyticum]
MRISCPVCGQGGEAVWYSPDYEPARHEAYLAEAVRFSFIWEGEATHTYLLSPGFMETHGIENATMPLTKDYPAWDALVRFECEDCFESRRLR